MESNFTLDGARQIAHAATGPRKRSPFADFEELLQILKDAEAAHNAAVDDLTELNEDSRQKQLLAEFAPAIRKVCSLWQELAIPGRQSILSRCSDRCPEDDTVRRQVADSDKKGLEQELLVEFLPAFAEAALEPRIRRLRDAASAKPINKPSQQFANENLIEMEEIVETRLMSVRDKRWKIYDIALKRLQRGAELAVEQLDGRGRHRPKELAGLEAFTTFIAQAWIAAPKSLAVAEFSCKFDYVSSSDGQSEYIPKSPASKFIWEASKYLQPPYLKGDFFKEQFYTVQNCETVMNYVSARRGEILGSNS